MQSMHSYYACVKRQVKKLFMIFTTKIFSKAHILLLNVKNAHVRLITRFENCGMSLGSRPKLDPNREIAIGAQEHFTAIQAFKKYHGIIENTKATFKRGLLIDLHGNSKDNGVTELGYCLPKMSLISNDFDIKQSSIGTLAQENPHLDLITGRYSFGDFVEAVGIPAVPSSQNPKPGKRAKRGYFFRFSNLMSSSFQSVKLFSLPID